MVCNLAFLTQCLSGDFYHLLANLTPRGKESVRSNLVALLFDAPLIVSASVSLGNWHQYLEQQQIYIEVVGLLPFLLDGVAQRELSCVAEWLVADLGSDLDL